MTDETEVVAQIADEPAPEQVETAPPETEVVDSPDDKATRTFTQEELDAIVSKRLAREQRKWEREQARRAVAQPEPVADVPPMDQFQSPEQYAEALAVKKAQELLQQREAERMQAEIADQYHAREEEARNKYDDFEQVVYNRNLPISTVMAQTIQASDIGPEVAYYLGTNPKEAERISRLSPFLQAKEIGRIEAKLVAEPPTRKTSSAPAPISPVTARNKTTGVFDTTDPRSVKSMSTSEWIEADRQRMIKKLEAQRLR